MKKMAHLLNVILLFVVQLYSSECVWIRGKKVEYVDLNSPEILEFYNKEKVTSLSPTPIPELKWDNVVIIMMTYNDEKDSNILKKNFNSWIKRISSTSLDIIIVTDHDDERTYKEMLPDADLVSPTIHLYKSNAINEGKQARSKTIDSLSFAYEKFKNDENKFLYLKIDPDTFVIPEVLLQHLIKVHTITYPLPADFGRVDCVLDGFRNCYSLGGTYGMSKSGLKSTLEYIKQHPQLLEDQSRHRMLDEDVFTSHVFHLSTKYPVIHISGIAVNLRSIRWKFKGPHEEVWDDRKIEDRLRTFTIHDVKNPEEVDQLERFYYGSEDKLREDMHDAIQ